MLLLHSRTPLTHSFYFCLWAFILYHYMIEMYTGQHKLYQCNQLNVLCSPCALLECLGASGIKCIIYAFLLFVAVCIQDEWRGRWNALLWLPEVKGSGMKNLLRLALFYLTHTHTQKHTRAQKQDSSLPSCPPPIPCHLLAYLKVTCRRGWMCGLQPLKCPHEAKELFVSFRVTEPGVTETGDSCRWAVFIITGRPFVSVERKHSCRMKYIWYMKENIKVGPLDGNFSWEALIQKKSLKRSTQAELVWQVNVVFRPLPWIPRSRLSNTAANFCHNMSFSL